MTHGGDGLCSVHYRRKLAYRGEPQGWVDTDKTRAHLVKLRKAGMRFRRIAELVGMNEDSVRKIYHGRRPRVQAATEAKILAVRSHELAPTAELVDGSHVLAVGTMRRLRSLMAMGYTQQYMADHIGYTRGGVGRIVNGRCKLVQARTANDVKRLFDALQMTWPQETPQTKKAKTIAARRGWPLPFAWDEDDMDVPSAKPRVQTVVEIVDTPPWFEEFQALKERGLTNEEIADKMGIHRTTLQVRLAKLRAAA